jgi:hypothetical protein
MDMQYVINPKPINNSEQWESGSHSLPGTTERQTSTPFFFEKITNIRYLSIN